VAVVVAVGTVEVAAAVGTFKSQSHLQSTAMLEEEAQAAGTAVGTAVDRTAAGETAVVDKAMPAVVLGGTVPAVRTATAAKGSRNRSTRVLVVVVVAATGTGMAGKLIGPVLGIHQARWNHLQHPPSFHKPHRTGTSCEWSSPLKPEMTQVRNC
jgi:hypothetical protein